MASDFDTEPCELLPSNVIVLDRCTVCSDHFEQPRHCFVQPEVNRLICKVLDVNPGQPPYSTSYFSSYVAICQECIRKIRKYDRLRVEVEALRREVVTAIVDTIVYIRPNDETPLKFLKDQILSKWVKKDGEVGMGPPETVHKSPLNNLRTPQEKIGPTSRPDSNRKTKVILKSPRKMTSDHLERQQESGRTINVDVPQSIDLTHVSIVADSETEAQAILAAYVAEQVAAPAKTVEDYEDVPEPDDDYSYFETGMDHDGPAESDKEWEEEFKGKRTKKNPKRRTVAMNRKKLKSKGPRTKLHKHARPPYFCEKCGQVYGRIDAHRRHVEFCNGLDTSAEAEERNITCSICTVSDFKDWVSLKLHIDQFHSDCVLDKCKLCKREFLPNTIEGHECKIEIRIHVPENSDPANQEPYKCSYCDNVYYKRGSLVEHVRMLHKDKPRFTCTVCRKHFSAKCLLEAHSKHHTSTNILKARFKCEDCGFPCSSRAGLREHKSIHTGERSFECEVCGKAFRLNKTLINHMAIHSKERKFACELCGLTFRLHFNLIRHLKICQKPPAPKKGKWCPICFSEDQLFRRLHPLQSHMRRCHPGTLEQIAICQEEGNRIFGFEAENEEEIRLILATSPAITSIPPANVQKLSSTPNMEPSRKRKLTTRKAEKDLGREEDSILAESDEEEDSQPDEEQPKKKLQKRRAPLEKVNEGDVKSDPEIEPKKEEARPYDRTRSSRVALKEASIVCKRINC